MTTSDACSDEPHLHGTMTVLLLFHGSALLVDRQIVGLFPSAAGPVARRCVELLARHGLADIPDTAAAVTGPWPPPTWPKAS